MDNIWNQVEAERTKQMNPSVMCCELAPLDVNADITDLPLFLLAVCLILRCRPVRRWSHCTPPLHGM